MLWLQVGLICAIQCDERARFVTQLTFVAGLQFMVFIEGIRIVCLKFPSSVVHVTRLPLQRMGSAIGIIGCLQIVAPVVHTPPVVACREAQHSVWVKLSVIGQHDIASPHRVVSQCLSDGRLITARHV